MNEDVVEFAGFLIRKTGDNTIKIISLAHNGVIAIIPITNNSIIMTTK